MPPDFWQQAESWGPPALILAVALWGLITGKVFTKGFVDRVIAVYEERLAELRKDRDEWKATAQANAPNINAMTKLLEAALSDAKEGKETLEQILSKLEKR